MKRLFILLLAVMSSNIQANSIENKINSNTLITINGNKDWVYKKDPYYNGINICEKNRTNYCLNVETGVLQSTYTPSGWLSKTWTIENSGNGYYRFKNNWKKSLYIKASGNNTIAGTITSTDVYSQWKTTKNQAIILLHGLNSDPQTWIDYIDYHFKDEKGYASNCNIIYGGNASYVIQASSKRFQYNPLNSAEQKTKCYAVKFGSKDSDRKGDFSSYFQLAEEVQQSVNHIINDLGSYTEIILIAHSRGGLAAREYLQGNYQLKDKVVGLVTTGTPHSGSRLGRIYNRMITCDNYPYKAGCDLDKQSAAFIQKETGLNLRSPSVGILSDLSYDIYNMKTNASLLPRNIQYAEIAYNGQWLGDLWRNGVIWNPLPSIGNSIDIILGNLSSNAESIVLYGTESSGLTTKEDRKKEAMKLQGDGIVDFNSQFLSKTQPSYLVNGLNISSYSYVKGIVHTKETSRVEDIGLAFGNMKYKLGWK